MDIIEFEGKEIKVKDLLKVLNLVPTGGIAKLIIKEEGILINGELNFLAGKKLRSGDEVIFDSYKILIK